MLSIRVCGVTSLWRVDFFVEIIKDSRARPSSAQQGAGGEYHYNFFCAMAFGGVDKIDTTVKSAAQDIDRFVFALAGAAA